MYNKGTVKIKFSNGFGNNLFQYSFGRLFAEYHDMNYCHPAIPELDIKSEKFKFNDNFKIIRFKGKNNLEAKKHDTNYYKYFRPFSEPCNFDFSRFIFYFEDYTIYKPYLNKIRSWFPLKTEKNVKDLVLHLRLQNRLVQNTHYYNSIHPEIYTKVISNNFNFEKLYIVTDAEKWDYFSKNDVEKLHNRYRNEGERFVPIKKTIQYMNSFIDCFKRFNPILRHSKKFIDDFNFMRSFDQIIFKDSTFAWWAATLSQSSKIGVFGPWKPNKKKRNKNLGKTDFDGWFSWGDIKDLKSMN